MVSRSGTLTYEAVRQLTALGLGQSTAIGIGGDPVNGTDFIDCLELFNDDAEHRRDLHDRRDRRQRRGRGRGRVHQGATSRSRSPAFIAGQTAPPGKRMGHAGAIISGGKGTAAAKIAALQAAGITVAQTPADMGTTLKRHSLGAKRLLRSYHHGYRTYVFHHQARRRRQERHRQDRQQARGRWPPGRRARRWCASPPSRPARFYAVHKERPFYNDLVTFMTEGPVVVQVLEGENAIKRNREIMGATNPAEAAEGTIRKELATNIERNAVHGSDAPETAAQEIAFFFSTAELAALAR